MKNEINRSDWLAMERTKLANEHTFLTYFRTFVAILSSVLAIFKIDILSDMIMLGYFLVIVAFTLNYDNQSAVAGTELDYMFSSGFGYKFD
jgi:putative membrane protein